MHPIISGQLWMKCRSQYPTLSDGNRMIHARDLYLGKNLYLWAM
jgi:hypothetical protein